MSDIGEFDGEVTVVPCGMCRATGVEPGGKHACEWCDGEKTAVALGHWVRASSDRQRAKLGHLLDEDVAITGTAGPTSVWDRA